MSKRKKYSGIIVPTVTPLTSSYNLDERAVELLFESFYEYKADPFIIGTTGESASLPLRVKKDFIRKAGAIKKPGTKLYTGISSTVLAESVELALFSFANGADAVAVTLPSYYALTGMQMKDYFIRLADEINAPLIVYNIPATTHMSIPVEMIDEMSKHPHIVAVKDSERSDERLDRSLALWKDRDDFSYLLGWAARSDKALLNGADGLIPSTGNVVPAVYAAMLEAAANIDADRVKELQQLSDSYGNIYQKDKTLGESLWALKVLLEMKGIGEANVMPPLTRLGDDEKKAIIRNWEQLSVSSTIQ